MKYRVKFTCRDYYDYVGTNPHYFKYKRVLESIPQRLAEKGYNLKFKRLNHNWLMLYRVQISIEGKENLDIVLKEMNQLSHLYENISYKEIKRLPMGIK